jgi:hypothetical protein
MDHAAARETLRHRRHLLAIIGNGQDRNDAILCFVADLKCDHFYSFRIPYTSAA